MKRIAISQLLFALLIPCLSLTAFAANEKPSTEDVEYNEFAISREDLELGTQEQCTVTVSQPYSYSNKIPKDASDDDNNSSDDYNRGYNDGYNNGLNNGNNNNNNSNNNLNNNNNNQNNVNKNVQTGDESPVALYAGIAGIGVMGMMGLRVKNKKEK